MTSTKSRLWAVAGVGTLVNLLFAGMTFAVSRERSWPVLAAWALLGILLLQPLALARQLQEVDRRSPDALTDRDRQRILYAALSPTLLALGLLFWTLRH